LLVLVHDENPKPSEKMGEVSCRGHGQAER